MRSVSTTTPRARTTSIVAHSATSQHQRQQAADGRLCRDLSARHPRDLGQARLHRPRADERERSPRCRISRMASQRRRDRLSFAGEWRGTFADQLDLVAACAPRRQRASSTISRPGARRRPGASPAPVVRPHASIGTAVKLPAMYEQFGALPAYFMPNPDLKPEASRGYDAGVELTWLGGKAVLDVTYFRANLTNKIASVVDFPTSNDRHQPRRQSTREGSRSPSRFLLSRRRSSLGLAYTYTDARNADGTREARRPPHSGRADVRYVRCRQGQRQHCRRTTMAGASTTRSMS